MENPRRQPMHLESKIDELIVRFIDGVNIMEIFDVVLTKVKILNQGSLWVIKNTVNGLKR